MKEVSQQGARLFVFKITIDWCTCFWT